TGISSAEIWVNLVMRRRQVELGPAPEHVVREEHAILDCDRILGRRVLGCERYGNQNRKCKNPQQGFHPASGNWFSDCRSRDSIRRDIKRGDTVRISGTL